jgi:exportin-2 (importin alpha re-exporter)
MEQLRAILPTLVTYLSTQEFVVYTYAAVTLERILLLKREDGLVFTKTDVAPLLQDLLGALFTLIEKDARPEKLAENDFLMRCTSLGVADCRCNACYDCESGYDGAVPTSCDSTSRWYSG